MWFNAQFSRTTQVSQHQISRKYTSPTVCNFIITIIVVVVDFIDINEKASGDTDKTHCCQLTKIQQTLIKVQSHKITITKQNSN